MASLLKGIPNGSAAFRALSAVALVIGSSMAVAQTRVTVENGPTAPVPVTGTVNVLSASQILYPYQQQGSIGDSASCSPQCIINFSVVPAGRRLVLTHVSSQLGANNSSFIIEGNGVSFFVQKPYPTASYLSEPVTVYFEPGTTPTARFFVPNAMEHTSLIVTFVGYFVPIPQP